MYLPVTQLDTRRRQLEDEWLAHVAYSNPRVRERSSRGWSGRLLGRLRAGRYGVSMPDARPTGASR